MTEIAEATGLTRQTVSGICHEDDVVATLEQRRAEIAAAHKDAISDLHGRALRVVADALGDEPEVAVALSVLRLTVPYASGQATPDAVPVRIVGADLIQTALSAIDDLRGPR